MIEPSTRLIASTHAFGSEVSGEVMLICVQTGKYFGMNQVGTEIWRRLQNVTSFAALSTGLQAHFKGDEGAIESEAMAFVAKLVERGLVRIVTDAA